ncbi:separin isoform X2 [Orussus abietinus]|uniref:separin isoform X2 n=1 Tax=Orussus abietinus TaxID=222816 RepID=UPI0006253817|nr:separin isoform X2 [Orussus abietinus]
MQFCEWYMIQVTAQHDHRKFIYNDLQRLPAMHSIHITVLPTGQQRIPLLCITVPTPKSQSTYDVCQEIHEILANCKFELQAPYSSKQIYWKMRQRQNDRMKTAVDGLEYTWLREWRILFMADPIDDLKSVKELQDMVDQLIANNSLIGITETSRWLLKKIVTSACFLTKREIELAIKHVLPGHTKLMKDIILFINEKAEEVKPLSSVKRKTLILIIDEQMDYIPFEAMEILKNHPVTRFPSLHIARALFKEHRNYIENGCRVVKNLGDIGTCIVNPSGNLMNMEKRMKVFMKYWLPRWTGLYNEEPQEDFFEKALTNHDVLMYNGHGSGIQYLSGEKIEKLRVRAIVLLFGCSSTKLIPIGGRFPPYGVSNQYLAACSPCILGMLWEVTDIDVDKMTASFVSNWIPAPLNARPWTDVIVNEWCNGNLKFKDKTEDIGCQSEEPEMLRAVAKSKQACSFYMTAAAAVVRGLPIIHQ